MNIVSVLNQKGGCGKTITAVNLAAGLSKRGHSVLLVDLDPQGHATFSLGDQSQLTVADILDSFTEGKTTPGDSLCTPISEKLCLIGSSIGLASLEHKLSSHPDKLRILSSFIKSSLTSFDYIIIDCPPNLGILTLNALVASNYALIPLMACDFSLRGMEILKNILIMVKEFNTACPTPFFLLNQVDNRSRFSREFTERIKIQLGRMLLGSFIRSNVHLREAASAGKNIFDYKPRSRGAEDFTLLSKEIESITTQQGWTSFFLKGKDLSEVYVVGDFNNWEKRDAYRLRQVGRDIWSINLLLKKGTYRYKFVAQNKWFSDPYNKLSENDHFGGRNSLVIA
jgi:chromosome partitioning protein